MLSTFFLVAAVVIGCYAAWNIGANDVANAMGTSVGSGALTYKRAILVAGVCEFIGVIVLGGHVTETIKTGIITPAYFTDQLHLALGMTGALIASALVVHAASLMGMPVSTTHAIVGAVFGFGLAGPGGWDGVSWRTMGLVVASWLISPLIGGAIAFLLFRLLRWAILRGDHPQRAAVRLAPVLTGTVVLILALSFVFKGGKHLWGNIGLAPPGAALALVIAGGAGVLAAALTRALLHPPESPPDMPTQLQAVTRIFAVLQVGTAAYVAIAHGANDIANAIGPLAAVLQIHETGSLATKAAVPTWILSVGGISLVVGLATFGYRVMRTVGEKITEMTPTRGFSAEFAAASVVLGASLIGLPISTTHTLIGAVIGVGFARGLAALDLRVVRNIIGGWFLTVPLAAVASALAFHLLVAVGG